MRIESTPLPEPWRRDRQVALNHGGLGVGRLSPPCGTPRPVVAGVILERAAERQVDALASDGLVIPGFQLHHSVETKARGAAPHGNIAVPEGELFHRVVTL